MTPDGAFAALRTIWENPQDSDVPAQMMNMHAGHWAIKFEEMIGRLPTQEEEDKIEKDWKDFQAR